MLKRVVVNMRTERWDVDVSPFDTPAEKLSVALASLDRGTAEVEQTQAAFSARLRLMPDVFSLSYDESEESGMAGTQTQVVFHPGSRSRVCMTRSGGVRTSLVFERGVRHESEYQTPIMPFEVCVCALRVDNGLGLGQNGIDGTLEVDYLVQLRGAQSQLCRMRVDVREE